MKPYITSGSSSAAIKASIASLRCCVPSASAAWIRRSGSAWPISDTSASVTSTPVVDRSSSALLNRLKLRWPSRSAPMIVSTRAASRLAATARTAARRTSQCSSCRAVSSGPSPSVGSMPTRPVIAASRSAAVPSRNVRAMRRSDSSRAVTSSTVTTRPTAPLSSRNAPTTTRCCIRSNSDDGTAGGHGIKYLWRAGARI